MEAATAAAKFRAGKAASAASTTAAEATTPTEATAAATANCGTTATAAAAACLRAKLGETFGRCGHWQNQADRCQCEQGHNRFSHDGFPPLDERSLLGIQHFRSGIIRRSDCVWQ
jgi:hypothetical protein